MAAPRGRGWSVRTPRSAPILLCRTGLLDAPARGQRAQRVKHGFGAKRTQGDRLRVESRVGEGVCARTGTGRRLRGDQRPQSRDARCDRARDSRLGKGRSHGRSRRCLQPGGPGRAARGVSRAGHSGEQQRGAAFPQLSRAGPPGSARRRHDEHGHADRTHPTRDRWDGRAPVREDRQHHVPEREDAALRARPLERRTCRPDGIPRGGRPRRRSQERHHQQPAAGELRYRPAQLRSRRRGQPTRRSGIDDRGGMAPRHPGTSIRAAIRAGPDLRLSLQRARRASSPARTFSWTAANIPPHSEAAR